MQASYKVWLEMSTREAEEGYDHDLDPVLCDEPYWRRFRELVEELVAKRIPHQISFDTEGGREYALVETMAPARQLTLEESNGPTIPQAI